MIGIAFGQSRNTAVSGDSTGRFQVIPVRRTIASTSDGKSVTWDEYSIIKLDTLTGETWVCLDFMKDGKNIFGWMPIPERN